MNQKIADLVSMLPKLLLLRGLSLTYEEAREQEKALIEDNKTLLPHTPIVGDSEFLNYITQQAMTNKDASHELSLLHFELRYLMIHFFETQGYIKYIDDEEVRKKASLALLRIWLIATRGLAKPDSKSPSARHFTLVEQAKTARVRRSASPMERALNSAIETELAGARVSRPTKEAEAMLDAVNRRLKEAGFEAVKVDVVRRRLEKRAALLKSAEQVPQ